MTRVLLLVLLVTAAGFIPAAVSYARREPPLPGRALPAGLRFASLALVLLLLVNPGFPGADPALAPAAAVRHWIVVEDHPVLGARAAGGGETVGDSLREVIRMRVEEAVPAGSVGVVEVEAPRGELAETSMQALARTILRLAEAGAGSLEVHTPLRGPLEPLEAVMRTLSSLPGPVQVTVYPVATGLRNAGISALELPDALPPGEVLEGAVVIGGEGASAEADSVRVRVRVRMTDGEDGPLVLDRWVRLPAPGERMRIPFDVELPGSAGVEVVADIALVGDAYAADDEIRIVLTRDPEAGGILFLSLSPDGEPRVLLPLLERATGLAGRGWIRVGEDRFVALGGPGEPLRVAATRDLGAEIRRARLLVLQGAGAVPDAWAAAHDAHPRRLILSVPAPDDGPAADEWSVDPDLPASPLSGYLSGNLEPGSARRLPPLGRPAPTGAVPGVPGAVGGVALRMLGPGGATLPAVILSEGETGREARVLVSGLWRWALRDGEGERFYRGLWGGLAAWILTPPTSGDVRGDLRGDLRGAEPGGLPDDEPGGELAELAELNPVAPVSMLPLPPGELERVAGTDAGAGPRVGRRDDPERPLRSHPLPWLLLVGLLSVEWLLRRRIGLR